MLELDFERWIEILLGKNISSGETIAFLGQESTGSSHGCQISKKLLRGDGMGNCWRENWTDG